MISIALLVKDVGAESPTSKGTLREVSLVGERQQLLVAMAWNEHADDLAQHVGRVVYLFNVWAGPSQRGDKQGVRKRGLHRDH